MLGVLNGGMTRVERWRLACVVAGFAVAYALVSLLNHCAFGTGPRDLSVFVQMVWHFSRFDMGPDTLRSLAHPFAHHFSPALFVLAPLFRVSGRAETLLVAQACLMAASIWPVYAFARDRLPVGAAFFVACTYGMFWPLQTTAATDFHELSLAPLPVACAVLAYSRGRWSWVWLASVAVMLVREDLIPAIAMLGGLTWFAGARAHGLGLIALTVATGVMVFVVIFPAAGAVAGGPFWANYTWVFTDPWHVFAALFSPEAKVRLWLAWLGPLGFLPLVSPISLVGFPIMLSRLLSERPEQYVVGSYYSAPLAPVLVMAAADGLARLRRHATTFWRRDVVCSCAAVVLLCLTIVAPRNLPLAALLRAETWRLPEWRHTAARALALVGPDESVASWAEVLAHVAPRAEWYELSAESPARPNVDVVVLAYPIVGDEGAAVVDALRSQYVAWRYTVVFDEDGWVVLRRPVR